MGVRSYGNDKRRSRDRQSDTRLRRSGVDVASSLQRSIGNRALSQQVELMAIQRRGEDGSPEDAAELIQDLRAGRCRFEHSEQFRTAEDRQSLDENFSEELIIDYGDKTLVLHVHNDEADHASKVHVKVSSFGAKLFDIHPDVWPAKFMQLAGLTTPFG